MNDFGESLTATLVKIRSPSGFIWRAPDGDFSIARIELEDGTDTICKGDFFDPAFGASYRFFGSWVTHAKYGRQFAAASMERILPSTCDGIKEYLVNSAKWVGEAISDRIISSFGAESLEVLRSNPDRVAAEISGISLEHAREIAAQLGEQQAHEQASVQLYHLLAKHHIGKRRVSQIIEKLGLEAAARIERNPFVLMQVAGIGFLRADSIWLSLKKEPNSTVRQSAALLHTLRGTIQQQGHCWVAENYLMSQTANQCQIGVTSTALADLVHRGYQAIDDGSEPNPVVAVEQNGDGAEYSTSALQAAESSVAQRVNLLNNEMPLEIEVDLSGLEEDQIAALDVLKQYQLSILAGCAGSGKSFLAARWLHALKNSGLKVLCCCPTGKAAKRLMELMRTCNCPVEARTIHRTLQTMPIGGGEWVFIHNESNSLDADIVVIDESSMISIDLCASLFRAIHPVRTRVVLCGDPFQLPPVGPGAPFRDLLKAGVPQFTLETIKRNAGSILEASNKVRNGQMPTPCTYTDLENKVNWRHAECKSAMSIRDMVAKLVDQVAARGFDPLWDLQVISPLNSKGEASCEAINRLLQEKLNSNPEIEGTEFRAGDKVVFRKNMEIAGWNREPRIQNGRPERSTVSQFVVNGDTGKVVWTDRFNRVVQFFDSDRWVWLTNDDPLQLAYCMTVHLFQGSESKCVIFVIDKSASILLSRELVYTAMTRAKDYLVTVGQLETLRKALPRSQMWQRRTKLAQKIIEQQEFLTQYEEVEL